MSFRDPTRAERRRRGPWKCNEKTNESIAYREGGLPMEDKLVERRFKAIEEQQIETERTLEKHTETLKDLSDEQKAQGELLMKTFKERSEERRVGKECRSRWSP